MIDKTKAEKEIRGVFAQYKKLTVKDRADVRALVGGKLYEIYVLSRVLKEVRMRGFSIKFVGANLKFKAGPGKIKQTDPHFDIFDNTALAFQLFVNIETKTMGSLQSSSQDLSCYHELDLAILKPNLTGKPQHDDIALAVECKDVAVLSKDIVRGILGLRRELSLLTGPTPKLLNLASWSKKFVPSNTGSEVWLVFSNAKGRKYSASPELFGIELFEWHP